MLHTLPALAYPHKLDQLAGLTGLGWTASVLGYLGSVIGFGNSIISRLVADPISLLYLGGVLLVATVGLDRLQNSLSIDES
jgi:hypothetical protein